mgnify:CR=1 FL=1
MLAEKSDRINIETYGRSHEHRELLLLTISSPGNLSNIDELQAEHIRKLNNGEAKGEDDPLVFFMGYGVHGNESLG